MVAPHVSGAAALCLAKNSTASASAVASALVNGSAYGAVAFAGAGSANRLLSVVFINSDAEPTTPGPESQTSQHVRNLYRDFLKRDASTSEVDYWLHDSRAARPHVEPLRKISRDRQNGRRPSTRSSIRTRSTANLTLEGWPIGREGRRRDAHRPHRSRVLQLT